MSAPVPKGFEQSASGLKWWDVKLVLDADGKDRRVHCTFLALDEVGARLRGVAFAQSEKQIIKEMVVSEAHVDPRAGVVPIPKDATPPPQVPAVVEQPKPEKRKLTLEQQRAVAAFSLVPIKLDIRLYTSDQGGKP